MTNPLRPAEANCGGCSAKIMIYALIPTHVNIRKCVLY